MYNPSLHTATNKPIGLTNKPVDARTYYYDTTLFTYRPYNDTDEVLAYLIGNDRVGQFNIIVNNENSSGYNEWWFRNGIGDINLVRKGVATWGEITGDILDQTDLIDYINEQVLKEVINLPSGSPYPYNFPLYDPYNYDFQYVVKLLISDIVYEPIYDVGLRINYNDSSLETIASIDIYGHTVDGTTTSDDLIITLYISKNSSMEGIVYKKFSTYALMELYINSLVVSSIVYQIIVLSDEENNLGNLTNYTYTNGILNWVATTPINL